MCFCRLIDSVSACLRTQDSNETDNIFGAICFFFFCLLIYVISSPEWNQNALSARRSVHASMNVLIIPIQKRKKMNKISATNIENKWTKTRSDFLRSGIDIGFCSIWMYLFTVVVRRVDVNRIVAGVRNGLWSASFSDLPGQFNSFAFQTNRWTLFWLTFSSCA